MKLALALLTALLLALAGCGGDDDGGGSGGDATALLKRGFATDVDTGTLDFDMKLEVRGVPGFSDPLELRLEGPFRAAPSPTEIPDVDLDFTASGVGQTFTGKVITTEENAWIEYEGETYEVGEKLWAQLIESGRRLNEGQPLTFADAGLDPLDWIRDAETDGEEELGGTQTTKVTGKLDVATALRDVNRLAGGQRLPESSLRELEQSLKDVDFEAWIGEDDIWRRVKADAEFDVPEDEQGSFGGLDGGRLSLDVKLEEPNEPVQIEGPAEARSIDQLLERLGIPPGTLLGPGYTSPTPG